MKFSLSLFMGLVVAATSATAAPVTYTINFTGNGLLPTFGQFTYNDMAAPGAAFSDFFVVWNGLTFGLTASANAPATLGDCTPPSAPATFSFLDGETPCTLNAPRIWTGIAASTIDVAVFHLTSSVTGHSIDLIRTWDPAYGRSGHGQGTFTISTPIPEPSTMSLALTGWVGAAFLSWKRRRRSLATTTPETAKH